MSEQMPVKFVFRRRRGLRWPWPLVIEEVYFTLRPEYTTESIIAILDDYLAQGYKLVGNTFGDRTDG